MKNLESLKNDLFVKELSENESKSINGSGAPGVYTGTRCTGTYSGTEYCWQDCGDSDGVD
jgi:hypothetical protein